MKKSNNKGFSFIELIIVIGVASILLGLIGLSYGYVNSTNVLKTGDRMMTAFQEARTSALTKGTDEGYCNLTIKNGGLYACTGKKITEGNVNFNTQKWEKIADRKLDVYFSGGALTEGKVKSYQFKQATGGLVSGAASVQFKHGDKQCWVNVDNITGKCTKTF